MANNDKMDLGFVIAGPSRAKILKVLNRMTRATPTQISKKTKLFPTNVSRTLNELRDKDLIQCITPGLKKGKIFELTENGKRVLNML